MTAATATTGTAGATPVLGGLREVRASRRKATDRVYLQQLIWISLRSFGLGRQS